MGMPISAKLRCDGCGSEVVVTQVAQHWGMCNGKKLLFTVYVCENCGTWNICQIDDADSIKYLGKIKRLLALRASGNYTKNQAGVYNSAQRRLNTQRKYLVKAYEGKKIEFIDIEHEVSRGWKVCGNVG